MIDFSLISQAIYYYRNLGYHHIEAPWLVNRSISNLTKPENKRDFLIDSLALVGSGEQSLLQLVVEGKIDKHKHNKLITTTACFRDDDIDDLHQRYFVKTEIMIIPTTLDESHLISKLTTLIKQAKGFFGQFISVKEVLLENNNFYDIVDCEYGIELGSYGVRTVNLPDSISFTYIYGTGLAEPRLSNLLRNKLPGYHDGIIPKGVLGQFSKIIEEMEEAKDAHLSQNPIMELVELSDLYGAIESYIQRLGLSMIDLQRMSDTTKRAFANGRR
jgi:hypothetical protein